MSWCWSYSFSLYRVGGFAFVWMVLGINQRVFLVRVCYEAAYKYKDKKAEETKKIENTEQTKEQKSCCQFLLRKVRNFPFIFAYIQYTYHELHKTWHFRYGFLYESGSQVRKITKSTNLIVQMENENGPSGFFLLGDCDDLCQARSGRNLRKGKNKNMRMRKALKCFQVWGHFLNVMSENP